MTTTLQRMLAGSIRTALVSAVLVALTQTAHAAQKTFSCTPVEVATFPKSRIDLQCSPGDGAISYFALGLSSQEDANRVLSLAATALTTKRKLLIFYDPNDQSGANIGCQTKDCRLILGLRLF